jgi:hypothetical protein
MTVYKYIILCPSPILAFVGALFSKLGHLKD